MNVLQSILFTCLVSTVTTATAQNVLINVLTRESGLITKGSTGFLEVTINNTDPKSAVGAYKVKTQISIPVAIASIPTKGHVLPPGWTILSNNGSTINLSNGTDTISPNRARTLLIAIQGKTIGGPATIIGQVSFSDGSPPGIKPGSMDGDNPADNSSTSTCKIIR